MKTNVTFAEHMLAKAGFKSPAEVERALPKPLKTRPIAVQAAPVEKFSINIVRGTYGVAPAPTCAFPGCDSVISRHATLCALHAVMKRRQEKGNTNEQPSTP